METNPEPNVAQIELAPNASLEFCLRLTRAYTTLTRRLDNALSSVHGLSFGDFMILYYLGHRASACAGWILRSAWGSPPRA